MEHIVGDSIENSAAIQDPRSVPSSEYQELVNVVNLTLAPFGVIHDDMHQTISSYYLLTSY